MEILTNKDLKRLQNLFSWKQFYQNSEQLAVSRYPRHYYFENGNKMNLQPESDVIKYNKIQEEIETIGAKNKN